MPKRIEIELDEKVVELLDRLGKRLGKNRDDTLDLILRDFLKWPIIAQAEFTQNIDRGNLEKLVFKLAKLWLKQKQYMLNYMGKEITIKAYSKRQIKEHFNIKSNSYMSNFCWLMKWDKDRKIDFDLIKSDLEMKEWK